MAVSYKEALITPTDLNKSTQELGLVTPDLNQMGA